MTPFTDNEALIAWTLILIIVAILVRVAQLFDKVEKITKELEDGAAVRTRGKNDQMRE